MCAFARTCDPACMIYRSGEVNYVYGYIYKCIFVFATESGFLMCVCVFF